jgi:hypothetical protein
MKLKNTYAIGTMVMFYEIEVITEFVQSLLNSTKHVENKENITIDFLFNLSEYSEKIDKDSITVDQLISKFKQECVLPLSRAGLHVVCNLNQDSTKLYSIGSYRRDFNNQYCHDYNYIVWGESDCLMPEQYFEVLEQISEYARSVDFYRYCVTFGVRKMWDDTWQILEHPSFTNAIFRQSDDPLCQIDSSSIWYAMSLDEMNVINLQSTEYDLRIIDYPRFDGSLLTISQDLILNGVNIPPAIQGTGEDTSFQNMIQIIMGNVYKQFVVKNILKVHNRNHPNKRKFIMGEDNKDNPRGRRSKNIVFDRIHKTSYHNLSIIGPTQQKFKQL